MFKAIRGRGNFQGRTVGAAKTIAEAPITDGSAALEIENWKVDELGVLDSTFRLMPFIPDKWSEGPEDPGHIPAPFEEGVKAIIFLRRFSEVPELLFLTPPVSGDGSVWRFTPWTRDGADHGLSEQFNYTYPGSSSESVLMQSKLRYPPQYEVVGNRAYFTFCDGGNAWIWDGARCRPFGFLQTPSAPDVEGPARASATSPNNAGFSVRGRIGFTDGSFTDANGVEVGGIDDGSWNYAVVWENVDGAYSATSPMSGSVTVNIQLADPSATPATNIEELLRRFRLRGIPVGPVGTSARVLLRTHNLQRLPDGVDGSLYFLMRIPNNISQEWIDDKPDGELGAYWEDRMATPSGFYFLKFFSGSMFVMRTDGQPSRVWWSEQANLNGPTPESFMLGHFRDVFPATGPITAAIVTRMTNVQEPPTMLIFKENATHFVTGQYPDWTFGTVHERAGCAGPGCVQIAGEGSTIWYGSRTFWRMDPDGRVSDIGAPIRRKLARVNVVRAEYGVSWVDQKLGEVVFALPYNDSDNNNYQFVWDWRLNGWRTRKDLTNIEAALPIPSTEMVLISGEYDGKRNVWVYGRGYPNYEVSYPTALYRTGWCSFDRVGPGMHNIYNAHDLIFTMVERGDGEAVVKTYQDWSLDDTINTESALLVHPEDDAVPFYDDAEWDDAPYRSYRFYNQRVPVDVASASVIASEISVEGPAALVSIDMYGPQVAMAGGRTPMQSE